MSKKDEINFSENEIKQSLRAIDKHLRNANLHASSVWIMYDKLDDDRAEKIEEIWNAVTDAVLKTNDLLLSYRSVDNPPNGQKPLKGRLVPPKFLSEDEEDELWAGLADRLNKGEEGDDE